MSNPRFVHYIVLSELGSGGERQRSKRISKVNLFRLITVTSLSLVSINTHSRLNREYTLYTLKLVSHSRLLEFDLQRDFLFRSTSSLSILSLLHSVLDGVYSEPLIRSSELMTSSKQPR